MTQFPCSGSHSVSPRSCKAAAPMLGTAASSSGPSAAVNREQVDAALVPVIDESELMQVANESEKEKDEKDEKEQEKLDAGEIEIEESNTESMR